MTFLSSVLRLSVQNYIVHAFPGLNRSVFNYPSIATPRTSGNLHQPKALRNNAKGSLHQMYVNLCLLFLSTEPAFDAQQPLVFHMGFHAPVLSEILQAHTQSWDAFGTIFH